MTSAIPLELVLVSVVIFVAVLVFVWIHDHFELPELGAESDEPFFNISEPNRRNQSATPPSAYGKAFRPS
jgi:hypothetical protein